jgi:hypothetical protein
MRRKLNVYVHNLSKSKILPKFRNWIHSSKKIKGFTRNMKNKRFSSCQKSIICKRSSSLPLHKPPNHSLKKGKNGNRN